MLTAHVAELLLWPPMLRLCRSSHSIHSQCPLSRRRPAAEHTGKQSSCLLLTSIACGGLESLVHPAGRTTSAQLVQVAGSTLLKLKG